MDPVENGPRVHIPYRIWTPWKMGPGSIFPIEYGPHGKWAPGPYSMGVHIMCYRIENGPRVVLLIQFVPGVT